ncbi:uncharacterized protein N7496_005742 [Penicillium cataractarum]|uniref:Trehalose synthase N-terminal domain-containing protein n=1 Tax=Penicillium cataractarum TaxID=2100454 RepID=A0A9W9SGT4_9EURO|nr:uncharacterized protein N7496_005742 [Penicillium cataractarum]KAJ5378333.1 hypothetical protein N7496_005742 [Penicillium cataractarum]
MPALCRQLWAELDIIPIILDEEPDINATAKSMTRIHFERKPIDEQAESLSRKCIRFFGPNNLPLLHVGFRGRVEVDSDFHIQLADRNSFRRTVRPKTWAAIDHYTSDLKRRGVKIAFFSATSQGGGVSLMRHALLRLAHELEIDIKCHDQTFSASRRRTNHNILQGVTAPDERLSRDNQQHLVNWIQDNAERYWLQREGPLCRPLDGGADVIIIDDPQMPGLFPIAKGIDPQRPVIYRSHIQMRSDLIAITGGPQAEVWNYLWEQIHAADIFISHPVADFVPKNIPSHRIDPAKGIVDALVAYEKFYSQISTLHPEMKIPKLVICGHGSIDDPNGSIVYDAVLRHMENFMPHLTAMICVLRLGPSD